MQAERTFQIDAFPDSAFRYVNRDAIISVDVIFSSTTVVTAAALGRRVFPTAHTEAALAVAALLENPILGAEVEGARPPGFEVGNSPVEISGRTDVERPLVLAAPGTTLMVNAGAAKVAYVACYRNLSATAAYVASHHERVVILGAGVGRDFRCEDQMAAAMIGRVLAARGFEPANVSTADLVARWSRAEVGMTHYGKSAAEARREGRLGDLEFVVSHFDDLQVVCRHRQGEVRGFDISHAGPPETVQRPDAIEQWWGHEWGIVVPFGPPGTALGDVPSDPRRR
jgi:2-phosphosulfolactate phosphatase